MLFSILRKIKLQIKNRHTQKEICTVYEDGTVND